MNWPFFIFALVSAGFINLVVIFITWVHWDTLKKAWAEEDKHLKQHKS